LGELTGLHRLFIALLDLNKTLNSRKKCQKGYQVAVWFGQGCQDFDIW
jgi:hypothetical protein